MRSARALLGFAAFGVFWGAWGATLPAVQRRAGVDDGELGLALVLVAVGALVSMRVTGVLIDRSRRSLTPLAVGLFGAAGILPALAGSSGQLYVFLLFLGAASGAVDVAINADAVWAERRTRRPLLNLAHAGFSGAVVIASLGTGALRAAGAGAGVVFGLAAAFVVAAAIAIATAREQRERVAPGARPRLFQRIPLWLASLGVLGATAYWIENAWQSWGAVHLERTLEAPAAASALAPALFAAAMAAGRLGVHLLARPGSERAVLVAGAAVAGAGSAVAALASSPPVALGGILVAGAGCSVCAPTIVSVAGRAAGPRQRGSVIGSLTTMMYLGFLVGPAAVGGVAEATSLRASLTAVAGLAFVLSLAFSVVRLPR